MKKYLLPIIVGLLLMGCAKKTHIVDNTKISKQTKISNDSTGQKKIETINRSITTIDKDIDSTITTTGKPLTGYISSLAYKTSDTLIDAYFENDNVSLYLQANKKTGIIRAIATPKPIKTSVKIHEKTTTHNDIHIIEALKSNLKTKTESKIDSTENHISDHTDPSAFVKDSRTIFIWFLVIIAIAGIVIYLVKKLNIISLVAGWVKKTI